MERVIRGWKKGMEAEQGGLGWIRGAAREGDAWGCATSVEGKLWYWGGREGARMRAGDREHGM